MYAPQLYLIIYACVSCVHMDTLCVCVWGGVVHHCSPEESEVFVILSWKLESLLCLLKEWQALLTSRPPLHPLHQNL